MLIAVPLGVAVRDRARPLARAAGAKASNFLMLLSFVMPEIVLGVASLYVVLYLLKFVPLGTPAQIMGLVTFQISYPVIIVRARLLSIGKEYEEAAMDLGATPEQSIRAVLLPLLAPAILASFAIVFADTIDDFVTVTYLAEGRRTSRCRRRSTRRSAGHRRRPSMRPPRSCSITTTFVIALGYLAYKRFSRGQQDARRTSRPRI